MVPPLLPTGADPPCTSCPSGWSGSSTAPGRSQGAPRSSSTSSPLLGYTSVDGIGGVDLGRSSAARFMILSRYRSVWSCSSLYLMQKVGMLMKLLCFGSHLAVCLSCSSHCMIILKIPVARAVVLYQVHWETFFCLLSTHVCL